MTNAVGQDVLRVCSTGFAPGKGPADGSGTGATLGFVGIRDAHGRKDGGFEALHQAGVFHPLVIKPQQMQKTV
jgi:hypothetical protein